MGGSPLSCLSHRRRGKTWAGRPWHLELSDMTPLDRKLLRDLSQMKGQSIAIVLVMACGVATFVMSLTTLESLEQSQAGYYDRYRFAHVFARVKRAPASLAGEIAEVPGV